MDPINKSFSPSPFNSLPPNPKPTKKSKILSSIKKILGKKEKEAEPKALNRRSLKLEKKEKVEKGRPKSSTFSHLNLKGKKSKSEAEIKGKGKSLFASEMGPSFSEANISQKRKSLSSAEKQQVNDYLTSGGKLTLEEIIKDETSPLFKSFYNFCKDQFQEENLNFALAIKYADSTQALKAIYDQFIKRGATEELNIESETRQEAKMIFESDELDITTATDFLNKVQTSEVNDMVKSQKDSFKNYLNS